MKIGIVYAAAAVETLRRAVHEMNHNYQVAWAVQDGAEALRRCVADRPDLLLLDLRLPGMDGAETTRRIMAAAPCAVLLVTANPRVDVGKVSEAMAAGALDVVTLPVSSTEDPAAIQAALSAKLQLLAKLIKPLAVRSDLKGVKRAISPKISAPTDKLVAIGASAGGPAALSAILAKLGQSFAVPIVVVQHVDKKFAEGLASWLDEQTHLRVRLAETGDRPCAGEVLIAGSNDHLIFTDATTLGYTPRPVEYPYRPSVDVFFESAARHWRGNLLAVLLTGMGRDGANGLKTLRTKGYRTIAQDEASSAIYGMPKQAAAIGAAVDILPLHRIAAELEKFSLVQP